MSKQNNLTDFLTGVANAIRNKTGSTDQIDPQDFEDRIANIQTSPNLEYDKYVQITQNGETMIYPESQYDGIGSLRIDVDTPTKYIADQSWTISENGQYYYYPQDYGADGFGRIYLYINTPVKKIESNYIKNIDQNGTYQVVPHYSYDGIDSMQINVNVRDPLFIRLTEYDSWKTTDSQNSTYLLSPYTLIEVSTDRTYWDINSECKYIPNYIFDSADWGNEILSGKKLSALYFDDSKTQELIDFVNGLSLIIDEDVTVLIQCTIYSIKLQVRKSSIDGVILELNNNNSNIIRIFDETNGFSRTFFNFDNPLQFNVVSQATGWNGVFVKRKNVLSIPNTIKFIGYLSRIEVLKYRGSLSDWFNQDFVFRQYYLTDIKEFYTNDTLIRDLVIPNDVSIIPSKRCMFINSLTSVTFPNQVTEIGEAVFSNCKNINNISFGSGLETTGRYAFQGCSSLTSITIPNNITEISWGSFSGCTSLSAINFGNGLTKIGGYAFNNCSSLINITIPNNITIEDNAFTGCTSLTTITIPNNVTLGTNVFSGCTSLQTATFENGRIGTGRFLFQDCTALTTVTIPSTITSIGDYLFANCSSLANINFEGTMAQWNSISFPSVWYTNIIATVVHCSDGDVSLI